MLRDTITPSHNCTATGILLQQTTASLLCSMYSMTILDNGLAARTCHTPLRAQHSQPSASNDLLALQHAPQLLCSGPAQYLYSSGAVAALCSLPCFICPLSPHSQARYSSRQQDVLSQQLYVGETSEYTNAMQSQVKHLQFAPSQVAF